MRDPNLARVASYVAQVNDASTLEDLDLIYQEVVGYSIAEDDADATADSARALLLDYAREECYAYGVHVSDVGLAI